MTGDRHLFVAPDNGVLSLIYDREERISVRHVTAEHYFLQSRATRSTRAIFSPRSRPILPRESTPTASATEINDYVRFGAPRPKPVDERTLRGIVLKVDRFGNLITNITPQDAPRLFEATPPDVPDRDWNQGAGNAHVRKLCRGRSGRSLWDSRQHGLSGSCRQSGLSLSALGAGKGSEVNAGDGREVSSS